MTARVLVVDDILANVKLLEAKLTAEYFDVLTARSGVEALDVIQRSVPDIILLDVMMPGMDGFEVCQRLKSNPHTQHIPVIMVTALDQPQDRVKGLEAGADDFLTKPVSDVALFSRVKSLVRLKMLTDELRSRAATSERMGLLDQEVQESMARKPGKVMLIDDKASSVERLMGALAEPHNVTVIQDPQQALFEAAEKNWELLIVSLNLQEFDGLRLCSQLRSLERTRQMPILIIVEPHDNARLLRALDMGVNDYLMRPIDKNELLARVFTQLRRHRYTERLRDNVQQSMEMAVTDPLTGLYNRRYMETHLGTLIDQAANRGKSISILVIDIDYFKAVNDNHGHDVGDQVLQEFALRISGNIRSIDMACRYGGEEFVLVMPDTDMTVAYRIGERLRQVVASVPFDVGVSKGPLDITISIGVSTMQGPGDTPEDVLKRADQALYRAKRDGRNRVVADAA
ncbi:MAG: PleD family two-component system response regulator [Hyphomicrobiales bacterium]